MNTTRKRWRALGCTGLALLGCTASPEERVSASEAKFTFDCNDRNQNLDAPLVVPALVMPVAPFNGIPGSVPVEFNRTNPYLRGYASCFGVPLRELLHTGRDIFVYPLTEVRAPVGARVVGVGEHERLDTGASSDILEIELGLTPGQQQAVADAMGAVAEPIMGGPWYAVFRHLTYGSTSHLHVGDFVAPGALLGGVADQASINNTHLHLEFRWRRDIINTCLPGIAGPGYFPVGVNLLTKGYLDPNIVIPILATATPRLACPSGCFLRPSGEGDVLRADIRPDRAVMCTQKGRMASNLEVDKLYICDGSSWTLERDIGSAACGASARPTSFANGRR